MTTNTAAWLEKDGAALSIGPASYPTPESDQIVVRTRAAAINPVDGYIQTMGLKLFNFMKYPTVLGSDAAGEVVEVGSDVTTFKKGDRVTGLCFGWALGKFEQGGFQTYSVLTSSMTAKIPDDMSFADASTIPLGLTTAACGFYQEEYLDLPYPTLSPAPTGKTLLIWGGASSVGCCAIQLAVSSGYEVITVASPKNFELLKSIGATDVFDYNSPTVNEDVIAAFSSREFGGALAIARGCLSKVFAVVQKLEGNRFVASAAHLEDGVVVPDGIGYKFIFATRLPRDVVGPAVFNSFLTDALAKGKFAIVPEARIVGHGLDKVQEALDTILEGVSATKLVVTL
ncbi:chaperonin 10-like protein [Dipodascopsis tothii]|uniref:chaperonin 10-like protein n=1 Tax=Dipodascopsis tothii TaxID=44089 RepID=UPI0034CD4B73